MPRVFGALLLFLLVLGTLFYLLQFWNIFDIRAFIFEKLRPFYPELEVRLTEEEGPPMDLEWLRIEKAKKQNALQALELEKKAMSLSEREGQLRQDKELFQVEKQLFEDEKDKQVKAIEEQERKRKTIRHMAQRIYSMPPQEAIEILLNWENEEVSRIFIALEESSLEEGNQNIVPYLLSLLPKKRAANIMEDMLNNKSK